MNIDRLAQKGAAFVEFALILPLILIPLTVGIFALGRIIWQAQALVEGARETTRLIAISSERFPSMTCSELYQLGEVERRRAFYHNSTWNASSLWQGSLNINAKRQFRANNPSGPSAILRGAFVHYYTMVDSSCFFCVSNLAVKINASVSVAMDLGAKSACLNET